jgi:hypothetical protein
VVLILIIVLSTTAHYIFFIFLMLILLLLIDLVMLWIVEVVGRYWAFLLILENPFRLLLNHCKLFLALIGTECVPVLSSRFIHRLAYLLLTICCISVS